MITIEFEKKVRKTEQRLLTIFLKGVILCLYRKPNKRGGGNIMKRLAVLYNYSLLLERMTEKQFTQSSLAKAVGMGRTSFNLKINNKGEFSQAEIFKIAKILSIDKQDVGKYFFNVFVQKTGQKV